MSGNTAQQSDFLYKKLALDIEGRIRRGEFRSGEKLPSLRTLHKKLGLSLATVYQAYMELEASGLVEAHPKSGFYVRVERIYNKPPPRYLKRITRPRQIRLDAITADVVNASLNPGFVPLGSSALSPDLLPHKHLGRIMKEILSRNAKKQLNYAPPDGDPELRRMIATRLLGILPGATGEDVLITNGCMEGIALALNLLVKPGQIVAVESPTHFGFLQLLKAMGLYAVAVPTDPRHGLVPEALAKVLDEYDVKACLTIPNFHNPLGALMPDERKKALVRLINDRGVPLIEDDIYGDMHFDPRRPGLLKSYDHRDLVITCSSTSKVLAPGFRVGWCLPGKRFYDQMLKLKTAFSMAAPTLQQSVIRRYMAGGEFDRYLRTLRTRLKHMTVETAMAVQRYFPADIRFTVPEGGNMLWVELPTNIDGLEVYQKALSAGISIVPGTAFTISGGYNNFIRISATTPFDERIEKGLMILGDIVKELGN